MTATMDQLQFQRDQAQFSQTTFTFPGHYPDRVSAFLDYLERNGGCDEHVAVNLVTDDDGELLVELTCWLLDKINIAGNSDPKPTATLSPSPTSPHQDIADAVAVGNLFNAGIRFRTQATIDFLGINAGAIPVNKSYTAPLFAIRSTPRINGQSMNCESIHFLWVLRSRERWGSSEEFRTEYNASPWIKYRDDVIAQVHNDHIPSQTEPWNSAPIRLFELVFFKTFPTVQSSNTDGSTTTTTTPTNTHETLCTHYPSFREDPILLAFDREASSMELLSWLGLHNDDFWFDVDNARTSFEAHTSSIPYTNIVPRSIEMILKMMKWKDAIYPNYRFIEWMITIFSTGYFYSKIPTTIRDDELIHHSHQDLMIDQFSSQYDRVLDEVWDQSRELKLDLPPTGNVGDQVGESLLFTPTPFFLIRIESMRWIFRFGLESWIRMYYWGNGKVVGLKKKLKKEKKYLQTLISRREELGLRQWLTVSIAMDVIMLMKPQPFLQSINIPIILVMTLLII